MNIKFDGNIAVVPGKRNPRGYSSEAAEQAFRDILEDEDMMVKSEILGIEIRIHCILTEIILEDCF